MIFYLNMNQLNMMNLQVEKLKENLGYLQNNNDLDMWFYPLIQCK